MKNVIGLIGRISVLALTAMLIEGMMTLGNAFNFENYDPISWIVQALILCTVVWGACEWHSAAEDIKK